MTTAIVTITCPSCGGRIEGVRTTDEEQTIKCTFCGTDLHIPRIGSDRVVYEVIREVVSGPVDPVDLRPKRVSRKVQGIISLVLLAVFGLSYAIINHRNSVEVDAIDQKYKALDQCNADCKASCANAGSDVPADLPDGPQGMQKLRRDSARISCETKCACY